jgi:CPA2 family monovalent cation:H+ antiporter-2
LLTGSQLAEIGVMLLMFGLGLHFSIDDLLAVRRIAIPGAVVQMAVATAMGAALALWWGWSVTGALAFGISLSVASTVVLLRALESRGMLETQNGRIAVGWLVVEDLAMVLVLVLLPALVEFTTAAGGAAAAAGAAGASGGLGGMHTADPSGGAGLWTTLAQALLAVGVFVALMLLGGRRVLPWLLWQISKTGSRELFTLCVVAVAVGIAYGAAALFGVSVALGAFFAGLVLRGSEFSHRAAQESLPLRDAFAVLFFVSVGMLFDPMVLVERPGQVAAVIVITVLGKSLAAAALALALRYPLNTALTVSASLAQIGEFSFILAALGASLGVLPMSTDRKFLARQVVLVGHGTVGRRIAAALAEREIAFVVVEHNRERVEALRTAGVAAVSGDAADPAALVQAHVAEAALLIVATPESTGTRSMIETARALNPGLPVVVRAPGAQEAALLHQAGAARVVHPRAAVAEAMLQGALDVLDAQGTHGSGGSRGAPGAAGGLRAPHGVGP